jgi:SanA protein
MAITVSHFSVEYHSNKYVYNNTTDVPKNKVGLLLGTSKYVVGGRPNLYFQYRIKAASELYFSGKVSYLIVSGDNSTINYNEPMMMKNTLVEKGIPKDRIYLDYAGFRTLDAVVRAREIFGQDSYTIISQPFHNKRAIFIARNKGINAIGYNATDVSGIASTRVKLREYLARVKLFIDLYVLDTQPKFLGEKIKIGKKNIEKSTKDTTK